MSKNKDYSFDFPEVEFPQFEFPESMFPKFEEFKVEELMLNVDKLLFISFNDFVS